MAADDYEARVEPAVFVRTTMSPAVWSDHDRDAGGVGWWDGRGDWRRQVVLSRYLQDSLNGAAEGAAGCGVGGEDGPGGPVR